MGSLDKKFQDILDGVAPDEELPTEQANILLRRVAEFNCRLYEVLNSFSSGKTEFLQYHGRLAGMMKALQSNLSHMTWQAEQVARGDYSQRVAFFGDFADAFNHMIDGLSLNQREIESRNREIVRIDNELKQDLHVAAEVQRSFAGNLLKLQFFMNLFVRFLVIFSAVLSSRNASFSCWGMQAVMERRRQ